MPVVSNAFDALDRQREIREGGEPSLREQFVTLAAIGDEVEIGMLDAGVVGEQSGNIRQAAGVEVIVVGANQIFVRHSLRNELSAYCPRAAGPRREICVV